MDIEKTYNVSTVSTVSTTSTITTLADFYNKLASSNADIGAQTFSFESWMDKFRTAYRLAAVKAAMDGTLFSDYAFSRYSHFLNPISIKVSLSTHYSYTIDTREIQRIMPDFDLKVWFDELFEHVISLQESKKKRYLDELLTTHDNEKLSKLLKHVRMPTEIHLDSDYSICLGAYAEYFN